MIRTTSFLLAWALAAGGVDPVEGAPQVVEEPSAPAEGFQSLATGAHQHLVVVTEGPGEIQGLLFRMERGQEAGSAGVEDRWRQAGDPVPVVVGRSGVGPKSEGDGRSPQGVFPLGPAFGYAPQAPPGVHFPYEPMAPGAVCVDDPGSPFYNQVFDPEKLPEGAVHDWTSAEAMRRDLAHEDGLYRWGVMVRYNEPPAAGRGSCIFLHVWRGPDSPTAGCTAMEGGELLSVLRWLDPAANPILIQGDPAYLEELAQEGILPYAVPG